MKLQNSFRFTCVVSKEVIDVTVWKWESSSFHSTTCKSHQRHTGNTTADFYQWTFKNN